MSTTVRTLLERKGYDVATIPGDRSVADAVALLAEHDIGALVVSDDGATVAGVLSERDVLRQLARMGAESLQRRVAEICTKEVTTCGLASTTDELSELMTGGRFRHVPVVDEGRLVGVVSIGDVVKSRITELETTKEQLEQYVTGSSY